MNTSITLIGCGILQKETDYLIKKNGWQLETRYLHSALHNYFDRLHAELDAGLAAAEKAGERTIVFYGACHPRLEQLLDRHHTCRTHGQNCIVMLIGYERFMEELSKGAYFLLEDWALTWEPMITECFGSNLKVVREVFHGSHKCMAAIRTPCSGDFTAAAEAAARFVDLPLVWMDADLSHLEAVLLEAITEREQRDRT
ncbi:MAG: DUF1638 domain-containing protein [Azonexus sp.]|nr:DUF1638 domain-containing protein [Azonexus sp.]